MKKVFTLFATALMALGVSAQSYKLTSMTQAEFEAGGANGFSFEKYTTGVGFSKFENCDYQSTANYVDVYQVEYAGGKIICEIEDVIAAGELTKASNERIAWYDLPFENPRDNSKGKFVYVAYDTREGYGMEINGNDEQTAVISFTVPEDGYYKFQGSVVRQDINNGFGTLDLVPLFRYSSDAAQALETGLSFNYTSETGTRADWSGNSTLAAGGDPRYLPQEPTDFTFAIQAKKGDIISFVENTKNTGIVSTWARDFQARSFVRQLDAEVITEAEATAADTYLNPYGEIDIDALTEYLDSLDNIVNDMACGTSFGQYSQEAKDAYLALAAQVLLDYDAGKVTTLTVQGYYDRIKAAFEALLATEVRFILESEGNYVLWDSETETDGNITINYDAELMAQNADQPWGYYRHTNNGDYVKLENHSDLNKSNEMAWYKGNNDWFYITDKGALHPMVSDAPAITFTAPEDGVYRLLYTIYRPNPNPGVENPLYVRTFFHKGGLQKVAYKTGSAYNDIYANEYGSVANDGNGGKAPVDGEMFVNMKAGDVITAEIDCYTSNRNSSAGSQFTRFYVLSHINNDLAYTVQDAQQSGAYFYNPYVAGDPSKLADAIGAAMDAMDAVEGKVGNESGKYSQDAYDLLQALFEDGTTAMDAAEAGDSSWDQVKLDGLAAEISAAIEALLNSRMPFEKIISGTWAVKTTDERYLAQNNRSGGTHYYAAIKNMNDLIAYCTKNNMEHDEVNLKFTFNYVDTLAASTITTEDGFVTKDGYVETDDTKELGVFRFWTLEADDELFAIERVADHRYWTTACTWASPYDKVGNSEKANYEFMLAPASTTIDAVEQVSIATVLATRYYAIDGRQISKPQQGVVIRQQILDNGKILTQKLMIK